MVPWTIKKYFKLTKQTTTKTKTTTTATIRKLQELKYTLQQDNFKSVSNSYMNRACVIGVNKLRDFFTVTI